jgi:metal-dependent amidase/aminoacylase/carboxypeptidase family protein
MRREHLRPEQRSHYVITDGGDQPNVVPSGRELSGISSASRILRRHLEEELRDRLTPSPKPPRPR